MAPPDAWRRGSRLNLNNGKTVTLLDIPADQAAAIAAIGNKPVAARPPAVTGPAGSDRPKTDIEIAADVRRRAAELAVQRQQLAAQSKRLRGNQ